MMIYDQFIIVCRSVSIVFQCTNYDIKYRYRRVIVQFVGTSYAITIYGPERTEYVCNGLSLKKLSVQLILIVNIICAYPMCLSRLRNNSCRYVAVHYRSCKISIETLVNRLNVQITLKITNPSRCRYWSFSKLARCFDITFAVSLDSNIMRTDYLATILFNYI